VAESRWDRGFAGYVCDLESQLYEVRNRQLNSALGVWARRDPRAEHSRWSLYAYCDCDPMNCIDPEGLQGDRNARQRCCEEAVRRRGGPRIVIRRGRNVCVVNIRCAEHCPLGFSGATQWPRPVGYRRYAIDICISNRVPQQSLDLVITHELAHARRFCRAARPGGRPPATCEACKASERAAYRVSCRMVFAPRRDRARYDRCVMCGVRFSCRHIPGCTNIGNCTLADIGVGTVRNA